MRIAFVLFALLVPTSLQDAQDDDLQKAVELLKTDPAKAIPKLEAIAAKKPDSDEAASALLAIAQHWVQKKENAKAIEVLRRFQKEFGAARVTHEARTLIEQAIGKRFGSPSARFAASFAATVQPIGAALVEYRLLALDRAHVLERFRKGESMILDGQATLLQSWTVRFNLESPSPQTIGCDVKTPGFYLIEEVIDGFAIRTAVTHRMHGLMVKCGRDQLFVHTYRLETGEPVAMDLEFYDDDRMRKLATDKSGCGTFERSGKEGWILGFAGQEILNAYVSEWYTEKPDACDIRTDRPLYRGGQTVHFRAIVRDRTPKGLAYKQAKTIPVEIRDPEDRRVYRRDLPVGALGTIDGSFTLADEPSLGTYRILVRDEHLTTDENLWWDSDHIGRFDVKAFRKPEIKVQIVAGALGKATITAKYLFGSPAAGAKVEWVVKERWTWEERREEFETPAAFAWYMHKRGDPWYWDESTIDRGEGVTDAEGKLAIEYKTDEITDGRSLLIDTMVVDESRRPAYAQTPIPMPGADVRLRFQFGRNFYRAGQRATVVVVASDLEGRPIRDRKIELGGFEPAGDGEFEQFFKGEVATDKFGAARFDVLIERAGPLRFRARSGQVIVRREMWSAGEETGEEEDVSLEAIPEQFVYRSDEKAVIFVRAGTKGMKALLTVETDRVVRHERIQISKRGQILEIPLPEVPGPMVTIKLHAWKDGLSAGTGVRLLVVPREKWLDVTVRADRETYRPREKAKVSIEVKDGHGRPVEGEVMLGAVDEAIYLLKADTSDDIRKVFYPPGDVYVDTLACGTYTDDLLDPFSDSSAGALTGATFSLDEEGGAPPLEGVVPTETRRWFPDTLHWGTVKTDAKGRAEVDLEVADSLTTWVFTAHAIGTSHQFGWGRSTTVVRKNVVARLVAPRFLTQGDECSVAVIVHNDLGSAETFDISLEAKGAEIVGKSSWRESVDGVKRVEFLVRTKGFGTVTLLAKAMGRRESDAMEIDLPIKVHGVQMAEHRSGKVDEVVVQKFALPKDALNPELVVVVSPGAASAVLDALPYLAGFPYGCVEQTMSRFLPSLMTHRALKKLGVRHAQLEADLPKMLNAGLQRLYGFQHEDGGWGWWKNDKTNPWMTAYVVMGLKEAKAAGVEIDERVLQGGIACLKSMPAEPYLMWALAPDLPAEFPEAKSARDRVYLALARGEYPEGIEDADVETTALLLQAALRLGKKTDALVQRILASRYGTAWRSTRESAFAIYALTDYLVSTGELATEQKAVVKVNGREVWRGSVTKETISEFTGLVRVKDLKPENEVRIEGTKGGLFYSATISWFEGGEPLRPSRGAIVVARRYERVVPRKDDESILEPLESGSQVKPGDILQVTVTLRADAGASNVLLEDPIPPGCEPIEEEEDGWDWWYCAREYRDDRVCIAANEVTPQPDTFTYRLRVMLPGRYHVLPARAWDMYDPTKSGTSGEFELRIGE